MGAYTSRGIDNESLMDRLVENDPRLCEYLERTMRLVDRGDYFDEKSSRAYVDLAWRCGSIHLSAPSIYMVVLDNLELEPGQHFLNIGSGSGYFNTVAGLVLGYNGVNHGIEAISHNVNFARQRVHTFLTSSDAPLERDFCMPHFVHGNIFDLVVSASKLHLSSNLNDSNSSNSSSGDEAGVTGGVGNGVPPHAEQSQFTAHISNTVDSEQSPPLEAGPLRQGKFKYVLIEKPPLISPTPDDILPILDQVVTSVTWPTYDRIYVGGAVRNTEHLRCILRLLKVGGVLVAPVRDELLKIRRISEDRITCEELLSVSFAPLIMPNRNTVSKAPLPFDREVPRLDMICSRLVRTVLRRSILARHGGIPILGRLEEVNQYRTNKRKRMDQATSSSNPTQSSGNDSAEENNSIPTTDSSDHASVHHLGGSISDSTEDDPSLPDSRSRHSTDQSSDSSDNDPRGGMARLFHHFIQRARLNGVASTSPPLDEYDQPVFVERNEHRPFAANVPNEGNDQSPIEFHFVPDPNQESNNNAGSTSTGMGRMVTISSTSTPKEGNSQAGRRRGKPSRVSRPSSYSYREEMMRIMSEELGLPKYFISIVMTL